MYVLALVLAAVVLAASWHCRQAACLVLAALAALSRSVVAMLPLAVAWHFRRVVLRTVPLAMFVLLLAVVPVAEAQFP